MILQKGARVGCVTALHVVMVTFSANQEVLTVEAAKDNRSYFLIKQGTFQGGERRNSLMCAFI